jgi:hypothetical protein
MLVKNYLYAPDFHLGLFNKQKTRINMKTICYLLLFTIFSSCAYSYNSPDSSWTVVRLKKLHDIYTTETGNFKYKQLWEGKYFSSVEINNDTISLLKKRFDSVYTFAKIFRGKIVNDVKDSYPRYDEFANGDSGISNILMNYGDSWGVFKGDTIFRADLIYKNKKFVKIDSIYNPKTKSGMLIGKYNGIPSYSRYGDSCIWGLYKIDNYGNEFHLLKYQGGRTWFVESTLIFPKYEIFDNFPVINVDFKGNVWIGVKDSILVYDGSNFKSIEPEELPSGFISENVEFGDIYNRSDSSVAISNDYDQFIYYKNGKWTLDTLFSNGKLVKKLVHTGYRYDSENNFWVCDGRYSHILFKISPDGKVKKFDCYPGYFLGNSEFPLYPQLIKDGKVYLTSRGFNFFIFDESKAKSSDVEYSESGLPQVYIFKTFPNPAKNKVNLDYFVSPYKLNDVRGGIYDINGNKLKDLNNELLNHKNLSIPLEIDVSELNNGIYYIVLSVDDENHVSGLIINR